MNPSKSLSIEILKLIILISGINAIYLSILNGFGFSGFSYPSSYIYNGDLFADFIKVVVSYPGAKNLLLSSNFGLVDIFTDYISSNQYKGLDGLEAKVLTHFHLPPFTTMVSLSSLSLMHFFPPQAVFYIVLVVVFFAVYKLIGFVFDSTREKLIWMLCFIFSYPFLFLLQRGNFFSVATSILIMFFTFSILKNKKILLGLFCMALALNIRPNAIFFLPILLLATNGRWFIRLLEILLMATCIFALSAILASSIYPDYSLANFIKGLAIYHDGYVIGRGGDAYNSSFFSLLKIAFKYSWFIESIGSLFGFLIAGIAVICFIKNKVDSTTLIFMLCVAYMCGSTTFADYHLLIFMLPLLKICMDEETLDPYTKGRGEFLKVSMVIFWACIFLLSPKNYLFDQNGVSVFILLNPMVGIYSVALLFFYGISSSRAVVHTLPSKISFSEKD